jgi:glycosyltransferase involved in cell wall biosynthesis
VNDQCVTIGVPVLNGAKTLARSLDSLISQKYDNLEVIVMDNDSDDDSLLIAQHYADKDKRVRAISLGRTDVGTNFARVVELCESPLFMWAADDDWWDENFLETGVSQLQDGTNYFSSNWWIGDIDSGQGVAPLAHPLYFLGEMDQKSRTLNFINLHHFSNKANLIYALYRTDFLRQILNRQSMLNDGVFTTLVASEGLGSLTNDVLFKKQFKPGRSIQILNRTKLTRGLRDVVGATVLRLNTHGGSFRAQKKDGLELFLAFYPEYESEICHIFSKYGVFSKPPFIIDKTLWIS